MDSRLLKRIADACSAFISVVEREL